MNVTGMARSFLISRYNIFVPSFRERIGLDNPQVYLDWCARRAELFTEITLPSVLAQTEQNFTWLIYFDTEINSYVELALNRIRPHDNIEPVFFDNRSGASEITLLESMGLEVAGRTGAGHDIVTTTRLDTDDALHKDYFAKVFAIVQNIGVEDVRQRPIAITFPFGAQEVGNRILAYHQDNNPFTTLVEFMAPQPRTIYAKDHRRIHRMARVRSATNSQPLWLQVIHEGNCGNSERPGLPELGPRDELLIAFGRPAGKLAATTRLELLSI